MKQTITLLPGDGIGPEIISSVKDVLFASSAEIEFEEVLAGSSALEKEGMLIPDRTIASIEKNKVALKGPITTPIGKGFQSVNVQLRKRFDLFANVRPVRSIPGLEGPYKDVDLVIFRENTEDLYAGIEEEISPEEKHSIKVITKKASKRIARAAFEFARSQAFSAEERAAEKTSPRAWKKPKVSIVTKANIMKLTDGLFLESCREVSQAYPEVETEEVLVDAMAMRLVLEPESVDIILTENLYGDILSDLCAGLVGGLGLVPGANIGKERAIFEAVHGSAPDLAGKNQANPTALILASCMMLDHIGQAKPAGDIRQALQRTLKAPEKRTPDLGGSLGTRDFTRALIRELQNG